MPIERSVRVYLYDILQEIAHIKSEMVGKSAKSTSESWMLRYSIQRCIEVISEATRRLPKSLTDSIRTFPGGRSAISERPPPRI